MLLSAHHLLLFLPLLQAATTAASSLTITIPPSNHLPNPNVLPAGTHATLTTLSSSPSDNKNIFTVPLTSSSTFVFPSLPSSSVPDGSRPRSESYLLDIRSREYVFAPYRVDVAADGTVIGVWETFRGNAWSNRGPELFGATAALAEGRVVEDVIVPAKVLARRGFYEERSTCEFFFSSLFFFFFPSFL